MSEGSHHYSGRYRALWIALSLVLMTCGSDSNVVDVSDLESATGIGSGLFQGYNSLDAVNILDGPQPTIPFDQTTHNDESTYTHETGTEDQITVRRDGTYEVSYSISFDCNYNNRVNLTAWVNVNGSEILPTRTYCYARNTTTRKCTVAAHFIVDLQEGDTITMQIDAATGATFGSNVDVDVIANESWIFIKWIGD